MSDFNSISADLKAGKYVPVYFLMGEESYFIDQLAEHFEKKVLDESERDFNLSVIYGNDTDIPGILSVSKRFPMMGDRTVVIVKEAQHLKALSRSDKSTEDGESEDKKKASGGALAMLQSYVENPQPQTILVFCYKYKSLDKRTALYKSLQKNAVLFESKKMYDDKLPGWISDQFRKSGFGIDPRAAQMMAEYLGNDLSKIMNEMEKLRLNIPAGSTITPDHIQRFVGISKEYNPFELNAALSRKDVLKANRIVNHFAADAKGNPLIMVIATLYSHFNKVLSYHYLPDKSKAASALGINPFFLRDYETAARNYPVQKTESIMAYLREYDLRSKGYNAGQAEDGDLLKELVFKILH